MVARICNDTNDARSMQRVQTLMKSEAIAQPQFLTLEQIQEIKDHNPTQTFRDEHQIPMTQLIICSTAKVFERWRQALDRKSLFRYCNLVYLHSPEQLRGSRRENSEVVLLERWQASPILDSEEAIARLEINFPGWELQPVIELPWLHPQPKFKPAKPTLINTWRSCSRCAYFLPGHPISVCNALRSLPENATAENDCTDFESL